MLLLSMALGQEEIDRGESVNAPVDAPDRTPYTTPANYTADPQNIRLTAPAPNAKTWAGFIDATYFQFQQRQPVWYFSDDFLYNTLDRMLGFDRANRMWRPLSVDENGNITTSGNLNLNIAPIFQDDFTGAVIDNALWSVTGAVTPGAGFAALTSIDSYLTCYLRSTDYFRNSPVNPLIYNIKMQITNADNDPFGNNVAFGLVNTNADLPSAYDTATPHISVAWGRIATNGSNLAIYLFYSNGTDTEIDNFTAAGLDFNSDINLTLQVTEKYAAVYLNGDFLGEASDVSVLPTEAYMNAYIAATGGGDPNETEAKIYKMYISQADEGMLLVAYDDKGYRRPLRTTYDGLLKVDTELTIPPSFTLTDVDITDQTTTLKVSPFDSTVWPISVPDPLTVSGTVSIDSLPDPVTVSGTVSVDSLPNPVTVSGTVSVDSLPNPVTVSGTVSVDSLPDPDAITQSAPTAETVGITSAEALAANANRRYACFINTSANWISLGFGANDAVLYSGITLAPNSGSYEMSEGANNVSLQAVNAIASAGTSNLAIQEGE